MTRSTTPTELASTNWLKAFSNTFRRSQLTVLFVKINQFILQIIGFWLFTKLLYTVVVQEQTVALNDTLILAVVLVLWSMCAALSDQLALTLKHRIEDELEGQLYSLLAQQQIAITRRYSTTHWQQLFLTHIEDIGDYLTQYTIQKWLSGVAPVLVLAALFPIHYIVAIALLLSMPTVPLFMVLIGGGAATLHRKHFVALERLGDMFSDRLKALLLITASGQHEHQLHRLKHASAIVNKKTMTVVSVAFLSTTVLDFFSTVSIALIAIFIGFSLLGEINIGPTITLQSGLFMLLVAPLLFAELRTLGRFYHQKAKAEAGAERFYEVLQGKQITERDDATDTFKGISWRDFKISSPPLHASKLELKVNDWVLLKGESGAGKSVLLESLMGFRDANYTLCGKIALMSQQACILNETVAFNLGVGHLEDTTASYTKIRNALVEVGLSNWLAKLSNGLDTLLEDCPALSGGEAQRLALARVLLQQKEMVLLDEPTAHLSYAQHQEIAQLIRHKLKNNTVIWASHKSLKEQWFTQCWTVRDNTVVTERLLINPTTPL